MPSSSDRAGDSPEPESPSGRRRSGRVKREKPDYFDALDFETAPKPRGQGTPGRPSASASQPSPKAKTAAASDQSGKPARGRPPKASSSSTGRATLTWKKGADDEEDERDRRRRKRPRPGDPDADECHMMEEVTTEKSLQCRVSLAEINRKLGVVMVQPATL